jgi:hypothetical protein
MYIAPSAAIGVHGISQAQEADFTYLDRVIWHYK